MNSKHDPAMLREGEGALSHSDAGVRTVFSDSEIEEFFASLRVAKGCVLAISGGPDSIGLLALIARWRDTNDVESIPPIFVASVDHALRPEASEEAQAVKVLANKLGFSARVLVWQGEKPTHAIQEAARAARYQLLTQAAQEWGASHIITAHHRDDQAETVLMRLANGSGVGGLGAMRPLVPLQHSDPDGEAPIFLARPLLAVSKQQLEAVVKEANLSAVDDPSNRNVRFARVRLRHLMAEREALGLSPDRLVTLAQRCARADCALSAIAREKFAALSVLENGQGKVYLAEILWREPEEIILRCIALALRHLAGEEGRDHVPLERLERLVATLQGARALGQGMQRTLHGMIVGIDKKGIITFCREPTRYRGRRNSG